MASDLDRLAALMNADDPEETSEQEKEAIDEDTVQTVLYEHSDVEPPHYRSVQTQEQIIETVRWAFAMDDVYHISTRRKAAQKLVAEHTEREHGDADSISPQAVQNKVRRLFDGRYGRQTAQDLFDDVLEDVEADYTARMENR
jgi:hypothetical protein